MTDWGFPPPNQRGSGKRVGPTNPGHLDNRSRSTSRGGNASKSRKPPKGGGGGKPPKKNGCPPFAILALGLGTAGAFQGLYVAHSLVSLATR